MATISDNENSCVKSDVDNNTNHENDKENVVIESSPGPFTLCGYIFGRHAATDIPVHYLSMMLKYLIPSDYLRDECLKHTISSEIRQNLLNLKLPLREKTVKLYITGSKSEGLAFPDHMVRGIGDYVVKGDERQILSFSNSFNNSVELHDIIDHLSINAQDSCKSKLEGCILELDTSPNHPQNCCTVRLTANFVQNSSICNKQDPQLKWLHDMLISVDTAVLNQFKSLHELCLNMYKTKESTSFESSNGSTCLGAISLLNWPTVASEWITRERSHGWTTQACITSVHKGGCHIIPVEDEEHSSLWVYSFFEAESVLTGLLTTNQRKCFVLLELLFLYSFQPQNVLKHYHLKNFFFWICEFIPATNFCDTNFGATFLTVLTTLRDVVRSRDLNHYFIRAINLLDEVAETDSEMVAQDIERIIENIIECIVNLDREVSFNGVLRQREQLGVCFASLLHSSRVRPMDEDAFLATAQDSLLDLTRSYLHNFAHVQFVDDLQERFQYTNVLTDMLREILIDLRDFSGLPETINNMDFMLGTLITARRDPETLARVYIHLCLRAGLSIKDKMVQILDGVCARADKFRSLCGKQMVIRDMIEVLTNMDIPDELATSNKAIYMQHFKETMVSSLLSR